MNKFKIICIPFLLFLAFLPVFAEESGIKKGDVLTLNRCIDIAVNNNPNIGLAENTTKIYQSRIGQTKSGYLPQLNLSSGYDRLNPSTNMSLADKTSNKYAGSIGLSQLIYDFGKTPTKVKVQDLYLDSSKADIDDIIIQVAYNVKQAYYSALAAKITTDIYNEAIKQYEQHLKQAKAFFEIGTKSKIDVTNAQVNLSNAQLNYIKANDSYKTYIANLNNAMGIPEAPEYNIDDNSELKKQTNTPERKIANKTETNKSTFKSGIIVYNIVDNITFNKYDVNFEEALKTAYDKRPDLKSLLSKEGAATASVKLAKKDYLPVVTGSANYGWNGQEFPLDPGWSFGANVTVPVFNGLLTKYQINEAKANLDIAKSNVNILKQNIYLQVQQAYINLTETEKRLPVAEVTVKQAKENLELANGRYNVGVGNSIEVQDAEINYNNAQLAYVQAFYDYNIARSNLEKAMGVK